MKTATESWLNIIPQLFLLNITFNFIKINTLKMIVMPWEKKIILLQSQNRNQDNLYFSTIKEHISFMSMTWSTLTLKLIYLRPFPVRKGRVFTHLLKHRIICKLIVNWFHKVLKHVLNKTTTKRETMAINVSMLLDKASCLLAIAIFLFFCF